MIAHPTLGVGIGLVLISFFATSNAGFIRVTSTGENASSPHCSWESTCQYDDASKGKCANALCQAKGYLSGSFVNSSNNFCNVSFTSDSVFLYMVDTNITEQGSYNAEASITADCDADTCDDLVQNQMEEDVDCGGPNCPICETCMDGMQNQDEEQTDCGGSKCEPCLPEDTCEDGILNGDEEDVDCGGSCPPCGGDKPAWYPGKYKICREARRKGKCDEPKIKAHCQRACRSFKDNDRYGKERCWALRWHCTKSLHVKKHCGKTCKTMSLNPEQ